MDVTESMDDFWAHYNVVFEKREEIVSLATEYLISMYARGYSNTPEESPAGYHQENSEENSVNYVSLSVNDDRLGTRDEDSFTEDEEFEHGILPNFVSVPQHCAMQQSYHKQPLKYRSEISHQYDREPPQCVLKNPCFWMISFLFVFSILFIALQ